MATIRVSVSSLKEAANKLESIKTEFSQSIQKLFHDGTQIAAICNEVSDNDFFGLLKGERVHLELLLTHK